MTTPARTSEGSVEDHVRRELARIGKEQELEKKVSEHDGALKKLTEQAPRKLRRLTRAVWGGE